MTTARTIAMTACAFLLTLGTLPAHALDSDKSINADNMNNADNTKVNARDREATEPTADQAQNNMSDREIMQKIRKAVVADKSLSTYAHNVKIISENGKVTLKGPVRNDAERENIVSKAVKIAGEDNVNDELSVKNSSKRG